MIDDLLNYQENSKSILLIDSFESDASILLYAFLNSLFQKENAYVCLYPSNRRACSNLNSLFGLKLKYVFKMKRTNINRLFIDYLFKANDQNKNECLFKLLFDDLLVKSNQTDELKQKKKFNLIFDNANLILRHFSSNPFKLIHFVIECNKRPNVNSIIMVIHKDSLDESILNQIKSVFQTCIYVNDTKVKPTDLLMFSKLNKQIFKYDLKIMNRNFKTAKTLVYDETLYLDDDFKIQKVEKHIKTSKSKEKAEQEENDDDPLKGLSFNVHISSDDLEAKKNLILPYEIIGLNKSQTKIEQPKRNDEESKIYYAPDERDDVDDDDPDDDLNF